MRISDWSSDVCSSDLNRHRAVRPGRTCRSATRRADAGGVRIAVTIGGEALGAPVTPDEMIEQACAAEAAGSEESRIGEACVRPVISWWSPTASKKTKLNQTNNNISKETTSIK